MKILMENAMMRDVLKFNEKMRAVVLEKEILLLILKMIDKDALDVEEKIYVVILKMEKWNILV